MPLPLYVYHLTLAGILGTLIGSFVNVIAYRVPNNISIITPRSACPNCEHQIRAKDNIPILSWLILKGKCRDCGTLISDRYPLVEALTGLLFVLTAAWAYNTRGDALTNPLLPVMLYLIAAGTALWLIDMDHMLLPRKILRPTYVVTVAGFMYAGHTSGEWHIKTAVISAAAWSAFFGGLWLAGVLLTGKAWMGWGDVLLSPVLGGVLGWVGGGYGASAVGMFSSFILGGAVATVMLLAGKAGGKSKVPFGPYLLAGTLFGVLYGQQMWNSYMGLT
jgi:leader peptidase (prepilin peptidase) / N-methyltransferase